MAAINENVTMKLKILMTLNIIVKNKHSFRISKESVQTDTIQSSAQFDKILFSPLNF